VGSVLESVKIVADAVFDAADDDRAGVDWLGRQSILADPHQISVSIEQLERSARSAFDILGGGGRNPEFALERALSLGHLLGPELLVEDKQIAAVVDDVAPNAVHRTDRSKEHGNTAR